MASSDETLRVALDLSNEHPGARVAPNVGPGSANAVVAFTDGSVVVVGPGGKIISDNRHVEPALDTYEGQIERLDLTYVRAVGADIAGHLHINHSPRGYAAQQRRVHHHPVGVNYQPDNGTSYQLVFVRVSGIVQAGQHVDRERSWPTPWPVPTGGFDPGRKPHPPSVLVVKHNGTGSDFS